MRLHVARASAAVGCAAAAVWVHLEGVCVAGRQHRLRESTSGAEAAATDVRESVRGIVQAVEAPSWTRAGTVAAVARGSAAFAAATKEDAEDKALAEFLESLERAEAGESGGDEADEPRKKGGKMMWLAVGVGIAIPLLTLPFVIVPAMPKKVFGMLPWVATSKDRITHIFEKLPESVHPVKGKKFVDVGSGDGAVVFEAAKRGFQAEGIEINPTLVAWSKIKSAVSLTRPTFTMANFWTSDVGDKDVIFCYLVRPLMPRFAVKCLSECKPGCVVVSHRFELPSVWQPIDSHDTLRVYQVPDDGAERDAMLAAARAEAGPDAE